MSRGSLQHVNHLVTKSTLRVRARKKCGKPCVFGGDVAPGVAEVGSLLVQPSTYKSYRQKVHRHIATARFTLQNVKKAACWEHFWKMKLAKCARDCSESSIRHIKSKKKLAQSNAESSPLSVLREQSSIWRDNPAIRVCKRKLLGTAARSTRGRAPGKWDCSWRLVTAARREELGCRSYKRASRQAAQSTGSPDK